VYLELEADFRFKVVVHKIVDRLSLFRILIALFKNAVQKKALNELFYFFKWSKKFFSALGICCTLLKHVFTLGKNPSL